MKHIWHMEKENIGGCDIVREDGYISSRIFGRNREWKMDDTSIVKLLWDRCEQALKELAAKYGRFCHKIALNILGSSEDAEECVNDTYLSVWNSIPPQRPSVLPPYVGRITKNHALNMYNKKHAEKRGGSNLTLVFEELDEVIAGYESADSALYRRELLSVISEFLEVLPEDKRKIFVRRYWYADSVKDIAARMHMTENNVSVSLNRMRSRLREILQEGGLLS